MIVNYSCGYDGCDCKEFYLMYDGYNIQMRCAKKGHYIRCIDKKSYKQLREYDNIKDNTGFDGGSIRINNR